MLLASEVDDNVGDNTYRNTLGYAVEQRHSYNAKISGDSAGEIVRIELKRGYISNHKEAYYVSFSPA